MQSKDPVNDLTFLCLLSWETIHEITLTSLHLQETRIVATIAIKDDARKHESTFMLDVPRFYVALYHLTRQQKSTQRVR